MLRATTKKGEGGQLQTKKTNKCTAVTCDMCLFSLYFVKYLIFIFINSLLKNLSHFYNMQLALRPPLNKKSFPVYRPGEFILWTYPAAFFFFFFFFENS